MQTDKNSVIGGYCSDQWEDTTDKKSSWGGSGWKDITSGSPFLFYWVNDEIQIIKHKDDVIPIMQSVKDCLMGFGIGLYINADQNKHSLVMASNKLWVHPKNTKYLTKKDNQLYFAGGKKTNFKCVDVEVWGLH